MYKEEFEVLLQENSLYKTKLSYMQDAFELYFGEHCYKHLKEYFGETNARDEGKTVSFDSGSLEYEVWKTYLLRIIHDKNKQDMVEGINRYWIGHKEDFFNRLSLYVDDGILRATAKKHLVTAAVNAYETNPLHCFYELVQNADDCEYPEHSERKICICPAENENAICISYDEKGMRYDDVIALCSLNETNKGEQDDKIGEKGQGFKTVFKIAKEVEIYSGGYAFRFLCKETAEGVEIKTERIDTNGNASGTLLVIYLKEQSKEEIMTGLLSMFGMVEKNKPLQKLFCNCPVFFTNQINALEMNMPDGTSYVLRRDKKAQTVEYLVNGECARSLPYITYSEEITFSEEACKERYGKEHSGTMQKTMSFVVPDYVRQPELLTEITEGCFYTFLPTEEKITVPLNIHAPAFLNKERTGLSVTQNGDICSMGKWNETIMDNLFDIAEEKSGIAGLFAFLKSNVKADCKKLFYLVPGSGLFSSQSVLQKWLIQNRETQWNKVYQRIPLFQRVDGNGYVTGSNAVMFFRAMDELGLSELYVKKLKESNDLPKEYQHVCRIEEPQGELDARLKLLGFRQLSLPSDKYSDEEKTALFNALFGTLDKSGYGEAQWECLKEIFNTSHGLLPCYNKRDLSIFPVVVHKNGKQEVEYRAVLTKERKGKFGRIEKKAEDIWLWYREGFISLSDADGYFKMLAVREETSWMPKEFITKESDAFWEELLGKVTTKKQFRDFMILYMRNQENGPYEEDEWFVYTKELISDYDEKKKEENAFVEKIMETVRTLG